jgi:Uma2 family endonuclease
LTIPPAVVNEGREGANDMATTLRPADWRTLESATEIVPPHPVDDDVLTALNRRYRPFGIERFGDGTLLVSPPAGFRSSAKNGELFGQIWLWNRTTAAGIVSESSGGLKLPDGAVLAPDATYVSRERWNTASESTYPLVVPDAAFELLSPSDRLRTTRKKIATYLRNGVRLAVLVDPLRRRVHVGREGDTAARDLGEIAVLDCAPAMPGFVLDVAAVFAVR